MFAGRKEGRKEEEEGRKERRKEEKKKGREDGEYQILCHINPLHHDISTHIHHTVFFTCPKVLTKMICLTIIASLDVDHFLYSCDLNL